MDSKGYTFDSIQLEVFKHRFSAIAEEMGVVLKKASYSPNIKERRDFSCAIFNARGQMIAQAAHIPVHLGSMPLSVKAAVNSKSYNLQPGDMIILNDQYQGGTHLPDITLVSPVFISDHNNTINNRLFGYVASRAHHADVGGMTPGSMPVAREIIQEGLIIPPVKIMGSGQLIQDVFDLLLANVRTPKERAGDLWAQIASNKRGEHRLIELALKFGSDMVSSAMDAMLAYTEKMTRNLIRNLPNGIYCFTDYMEGDGFTSEPIPITAQIKIQGDTAQVDFTGSAPQQKGSINAVYAITLSAVYYVFRCMLNLDVPNNEGCLNPIEVIAPEGTIVNAQYPAPVAGGNVETSQRIVDVLLGALALAAPDQIPAASQGTMNNLTIGIQDGKTLLAYYETIAGGTGALPDRDGTTAVHSHMTNTLNTPIEALEYAYPLQVMRYEIRRNSGGKGKFKGGDGIRRDIKILKESQVTLLTERRKSRPYALEQGEAGKPGENKVYRGDEIISLPAKGSFDLRAGDIISIETPGGGGFGELNN